MTYILGTKPIKIIFCNKWAKCQRSQHFPSVNLTFRYGWKIWKATPQRQNELSMYIVKLWDRRQSDNFELLCNKCDLQLNLAATYSIPLHHYNINTTLTSWWHTHTHRGKTLGDDEEHKSSDLLPLAPSCTSHGGDRIPTNMTETRHLLRHYCGTTTNYF